METEWISVKERLPTHSNDVLVRGDGDTRYMGRFYISGGSHWKLYFSDTGLQYDKYKSDKVTHWMELP